MIVSAPKDVAGTVMNSRRTPGQESYTASPLIDITNVRKSFAVGDQPILALADVSMRVDSGEFIAVIGRSGSGKSTLMSVLGLLEKPDTGRYLLGGRDVQVIDEDSRAGIRSREIGFIFQFPAL